MTTEKRVVIEVSDLESYLIILGLNHVIASSCVAIGSGPLNDALFNIDLISNEFDPTVAMKMAADIANMIVLEKKSQSEKPRKLD